MSSDDRSWRARRRLPRSALLAQVLTLVLGLLTIAGGAAVVVRASSSGVMDPNRPSGYPPPPPLYFPIVAKGPPPPVIDLSVNRIEIIQGVAMGNAFTVQVAGRPALVRVFVGLTGAGTQAGVTGSLTRYVAGVAQDSLNAGPITVLAATDEGNLAETLNFTLPANWLSAGTSYVLQLDPANTIPEVNEGNNRYPASGQASFNFQNAPVLNVVIVPVHYARSGASPTDPPTNDLSYLTWLPIKVYPLSQINYSLHSSMEFNGDLSLANPNGQGWIDLLSQITSVHQGEDPNQLNEYVAVVDSVAADGCSGGCIAGIAWVNGPGGVLKSAVSFAGFTNDRNIASPIMTHEMGHNFGRYHSPCGTQNQLDPAYPYANATLGQWGYDNVAGQLKDPNAYRDYMSYCDPAWTSDFTYHALFNAWSWVSQPYGAAAQNDLTDAWVINGSYDPAGQWHVSPAHTLAVPRAELAGGGPFRLELLDGAGRLLATQSFGSMTISLDQFRTGFYQQGFRLAVPTVPGLAGFRIYRDSQLLFQRVATGPAPKLGAAAAATITPGGAQLNWGLANGYNGVTYRVRASPDGGQSWQVLAVDQTQPSIALPPVVLKGATRPIVEVQASDGVRTDTHTYALPQP